MSKRDSLIRNWLTGLRDQGNFSRGALWAIGLGGAGLAFGSVWIADYLPRWLMLACVHLGTVLMLVSRLGLNARQLRLRVFGQEEWRRAKATYTDEDAAPSGSSDRGQ